jgi:hypothetical protein
MSSTLLRHICILLAVTAFALAAPADVRAGDSGEDIYWKAAGECFGGEYPSQHAETIVRVGSDIYLGGYFEYIGEKLVNNIARWDGTQWHALGKGMSTIGETTVVHSLYVVGDDLYVAGMFDNADDRAAHCVARYNMVERRFYPLGNGPDRAVRGVAATEDGQVYIVGEFTVVNNNIPSQGVGYWDGWQWTNMNGGLNPRARARAVAIYDGEVYIAGFFNTAGGVPCNNIAKWDGETWIPLGEGTNDLVSTLTVADGKVYAGGPFTQAGGSPAKSIAVWNGTRWSTLGGGLTGTTFMLVHSILVDGGQIHVGGTFTHAGSEDANRIANWRGGDWHSFGTGTNEQVKMIKRFDDELYVVGNFTAAGGKEASRVAIWNKDVVDVRSFSAKGVTNGVELTWDVASVGPVLGINIHRTTVGEADGEIMFELTADATSFVDETAEMGRDYEYRLGVVRHDGTEVSSNRVMVGPTPSLLQLGQNFPNPFTPRTSISFTLDADGPVALRIYDIKGRLVRTLVSGSRTAGPYSEAWNGKNDAGDEVSAGVYLYRLEASGQTLARKMILIR